ncbi:MAG: helix-turn-helix transcriptional regulator [Oscillospiraceae bacterium]|nr:helix-turn-helix transcriptional regulator [Oscillospiraceae bacterium]
MVAVNKLRGIIAERGMSQRQVAKYLGMTEKTFYSKMQKGVFGTDEAEKMIELLSIENPSEIFFAPEVTYKVT